MTDRDWFAAFAIFGMAHTAKPAHRELYPEQYAHPLVGQRVRVTLRSGPAVEGLVRRVMATRFGDLVDLGTHDPVDGSMVAYALADCQVIA